MTQPVIYMIAGPNGAGKTTAALKLLPDFLSVHEFVNADEIAHGLNPLAPDSQAVAAGKLMLRRIGDLIDAKKSFAFETTGASRVFVETLKHAKERGYQLGLIYLWLPSAEFATQRVRLRVAQGGHHIPEATIKRRYSRSIRNLVTIYFPIMDTITISDNTSPAIRSRKLIASKRDGKWTIIHNKKNIWNDIQAKAGEATDE